MATILIVDDHSVHRSFLGALLGEQTHRLLEASDGLEALQIAGAEHPDLIITDIMMPRMDGYQFTMRLREDPLLAAIPVIFYTSTYSTTEANVMAAECGVTCVLQKPSPPQRIVDAVHRALGLPAQDCGGRPAAAVPVGRFEAINQALLSHDTALPLAQALEDYQSVAVRLTALIDMGFEIASERSASLLIEHGCRIARHVGLARFSIAAILAPEGRAYTHLCARGLAPEVEQQMAAAGPPDGIFALLRTERRAQRLQGATLDRAACGLPPSWPALDCLLLVPIATTDQFYGWICLGGKLGASQFSVTDEEVLSAVATQIAVAYENLLLFERIERSLLLLQDEMRERQRVGAHLEESERRFSDMLGNVELLAVMIDRDARISYCNEFLLRLTGWGRSELIGQDFLSVLFAPELREEVGAALRKALAQETGAMHHQNEIKTRDGRRRLINWNHSVLRAPNGDVIGLASVGEDISEAVRLREALQLREAGLLRAQQISKLGHVVTDVDGAFLSWSDSLAALLGIEIDAMPPTTRHWLDIVHPADRDLFRNCCIAAGVSGTQHQVGYRVRRADGCWIHVHQVFEPLPGARSAEGKCRWFNTIQDVTEQTEQSNKLARISRIHAVKSGINSAIVRIHDRMALLHEAGRIAVVDGAFSMAWVGLVGAPDAEGRVIGWLADPNNDAINRLIRENAAVGPTHPACRAARDMRLLVCDDIQSDPSLIAVRALLVEQGHCSCAVLPLVVDGQVVAVIALFATEVGFFDLEEQSLLNDLGADLSFGLSFIEKSERLQFMANYDVLTGLPNRSLFLDRLGQALLECEQSNGVACVMLLNIDRFGQINDVFGRSAGDAVLRMVGQRLAAQSAIAHSIARLGGDLFALILRDLVDPTGAASHVELGLLDPLEAPFLHEGRELVVSASAGLAVYPHDGGDAETLIKHAELAVKNAKLSGLRTQYFSAQMNSANAARVELESALRAALEEQQFVIHYQPRIDLISGRIVSAEALVRWQHPRRGLVAPTQFIPLCEELGLIVPLGAWIIDAVCAQQALWRQQGLAIVPVAVNLSALQFRKGKLMQTIAKAKSDHGLEQEFLEFELTESMVMNDSERAILDLRALKEIGAQLSLDDFGTGYSSLAYLQQFPFDFVKIDRSFVTNLTSNPADAAIVTAVIAMAHSLGLSVVAEGVETEGQLRFLRRLRCDQLQGYYFSPAVDPSCFAGMLRDEKCLVFSSALEEWQETLLVVDDEASNLSSLNRMFRRDGYRILLASSGKEALELLAANGVQVIICDQRMPGMSGIEFLSVVKQLYPNTMRIILSGYTDLAVVTNSVNEGAIFKFLTKPWDDDVLRAHVRDAFILHRKQLPKPIVENV